VYHLLVYVEWAADPLVVVGGGEVRGVIRTPREFAQLFSTASQRLVYSVVIIVINVM
jgi:hypothetical protein